MDLGILRICLLLAGCVAVATAQSIKAANWSMTDASEQQDSMVELSISTGNTMVPLSAVLPLTTRAGHNIPAPGISGTAILANASNELSLNDHDIAVISCDQSAYVGNIDALHVFGSAISSNVSGVILYSEQADWCNLGGYSGSFSWIYSMKSHNDTQKVLDGIDSYGEENNGAVYLTVEPTEAVTPTTTDSASANASSSPNNNNDNNNSQNQQNPLGPSPTTAVAMVILYAITGLITALFLAIIITGAVRAHRHPERYGPRNITGRPRQSRARGLARAMLDTIPIVKFGERTEPKPADVELADSRADRDATDAARMPVAVDGQHSEQTKTGEAAEAVSRDGAQGTVEDRAEPMVEGGIAPAVGTHSGEAPQEAETQGCSICTEDFEVGQDQRVLPCDHRFHPACIDPWLLNVSGTCPLCRVDLRPQDTSSAAEGEADEHSNSLVSQGDGNGGESGMAPPLAAAEDGTRRESTRRSVVRSWILGLGQPERMTREEGVLALREYRGRLAAQMGRRQQSEGEPATETPAAEIRLRTRLRNAFRIGTRRIGQEENTTASAVERS